MQKKPVVKKKSESLSGNKLSITRGSALMERAARKSVSSKKKSPAAKAFFDINKQGLTRVFVAGGSRSGKDPLYEEQAFMLGEEIGKKNYRLDFGLSSKGIMGAVAKGVLKGWSETKTKSMAEKPIHAVTTKEYLALYQSDSVIDEVSDIIVSHTLEERKQQLLGADFVIFAPGGVGTLDELAYDCVAMQDGFLNFKPFVLFNVQGFFYHLLEYLKKIQKEGFASVIPFIVADDSFEASVAFDMIDLFYKKEIEKKPTHAKSILNRLIYLLPYVIYRRHLYHTESTKMILTKMEEVYKHGLPKEKKQLEDDIETAYLNKEIERMYERLAKAGKDTASVSDKLHKLKSRYRHGSRFKMPQW